MVLYVIKTWKSFYPFSLVVPVVLFIKLKYNPKEAVILLNSFQDVLTGF